MKITITTNDFGLLVEYNEDSISQRLTADQKDAIEEGFSNEAFWHSFIDAVMGSLVDED